jgi:hypothetical protein
MVDEAGERPLGPVLLPSAPASAPGPAPLESCMKAISAGRSSWTDAIASPSDELAKASPDLAAILRSSAVRTNYEIFKRQDAEAVRQQASLVQEATRSNICLMAAGVASGLVLLLAAQSSAGQAAFLPIDDIKKPTLFLGLLTLALGAAGAFFQYLARDQGRVARWQARRGEAEIARLNVFTTVAGMAAGRSTTVAMYALALVIRWLVDDQRSWFDGRALRHRQSSEVTSKWGGFANALAFIGGSGAVIASQTSGSYWIVFAGVIGAAIAAFAGNRDALLRDRANADRYEKAQVALDVLAGRTDDVAAQIAGGEPKAVIAFTDAVTDLLSTEHKQWLEGTQQAEALLDKLDAQLKELNGANKP